MPRSSTRLDELHLIRRWTDEEGRIAVEALQASGLSAEDFAARHGLHPLRVARWAARLGPGLPTAMVPVDVVPAPGVGAVVELVLGSRILRIPADLHDATLARLIRLVESV